MSIGDVAVSQNNPDLVYVGTGESNNRQSTSWGDGVYKSTDGGKTYTNVGLKTSRHINRILIDPRNNDIVLVAATGPLFGPGGERGDLQDDRRRQDLDAGPEGRRRHRRQRPRHGRRQQQDSVRLDLSAPPHGVLHERRRPRQRHLEIHRRRRDLDAAERPASRRDRSGASRSTSSRRRPNILYALIEGPAPAGRGAAGGGGARGRSRRRQRPAGAGGGRGGGRPRSGAGRSRSRAGRGGARRRPRSSADAAWPPASTTRRRASIAPTTPARPGARSTTKTRGRCTSARCASIPTTPTRCSWAASKLHLTTDGGKTINTNVDHRGARRRARDLGSIPPTRTTCMIGDDGGLAVTLRPGQDVAVLPQPAGRALLPRQLRHGDAVQRLRRHAGQLRLVRSQPGARRRRHRQLQLGRRSRAATASSSCRIRRIRASSTARPRTATWCASTA